MKGKVFALSFQPYVFIVAIITLILYIYLRSGLREGRLQEGACRKFLEEGSQEKPPLRVKQTSPWLFLGTDATWGKVAHSSSGPVPEVS